MMMKLRYLRPVLLIAFAFAGCAAQVNQSAAQNALAAGRLDEAAADVQTALSHDPDNLQLKSLAADIFTRRGVQYYQQGAMIAAQADFQRAVGYQPNYAMAWDYLGLLASAQNDWQHAIEYGTRAASLEGKPDPSYVAFARKQLARIKSGGVRPYAAPSPRP
jgi:tetratricopeptide (TPR) repeat protein